MRYAFRRLVDSKTKGFRFRLRLLDDSIDIRVEDGAEQAQANFTLEMLEIVDGEAQPQWTLAVRCELRKLSGEWRILRSSQQTLEGEMPR